MNYVAIIFHFPSQTRHRTDGYSHIVNILENGFDPTLFKMYKEEFSKPDKELKYETNKTISLEKLHRQFSQE